MTNNYIFLNIKNRSGSVQHYYHFLLGLLVPLVIRLDAAETLNTSIQFFVRSCGPMDRHLLSLNYKNLNLLNPGETVDSIELNRKIIHESLNGFDNPIYYNQSAFIKATKIIKSRLKEELDSLQNRKSQSTMLINRSTDNFYKTNLSEIKTSGIERRSIPNFHELELIIKEKCNDACTVILEKATLAEQIICFENASTIVAQHGAALTNLLFCKRNTKVIEIAPENMLPIGHFSKLANILDIQHIFHVTNSNHSPVDLEKISRQLI